MLPAASKLQSMGSPDGLSTRFPSISKLPTVDCVRTTGEKAIANPSAIKSTLMLDTLHVRRPFILDLLSIRLKLFLIVRGLAGGVPPPFKRTCRDSRRLFREQFL